MENTNTVDTNTTKVGRDLNYAFLQAPKDNVNHPSHYAEGRNYEPINVIIDWGLDFALGNTIKYISRAGRKDPDKMIEDLEKARWYLDWEIKYQKGEIL